MLSFETETGCTVSIKTLSDGFSYLHLDMLQPGDRRHAEVRLSIDEMKILAGLLQKESSGSPS